MPRLHTLSDEQLSTDFNQQTQHLRIGGKLADVYRELANSEPATLAYLQMEQALQQGPLSDQQVEAVKLVVSEFNQCEFCLSTHQVKSQRMGFSAEQILAIRARKAIGDADVDAVVEFTAAVLDKRGVLNDQDYQQMRDAGFSDQALVDILLAISAISFTNYFNGLNNTALMFKTAPTLAE